MLTIAAVIFPVVVTSEGINCYNFWGAYDAVVWSEMKSFQVVNLLGLRYIRVTSTDNKEFWVPLYLAGMEEFTATLREFAGPEHPLVVAIENDRKR